MDTEAAWRAWFTDRYGIPPAQAGSIRLTIMDLREAFINGERWAEVQRKQRS